MLFRLLDSQVPLHRIIMQNNPKLCNEICITETSELEILDISTFSLAPSISFPLNRKESNLKFRISYQNSRGKVDNKMISILRLAKVKNVWIFLINLIFAFALSLNNSIPSTF